MILYDEHHPALQIAFCFLVAWLVFAGCFAVQTLYIVIVDWRAGQFLESQKAWSERVGHIETAVFGSTHLKGEVR